MDVNQSLHEFLAAFFLFFCVSWKTIGQRGTGAHNSGFCDIENKRKRGSDKNNNNEHPLLQTPPFPYGSLKTKVLKAFIQEQMKTDIFTSQNTELLLSLFDDKYERIRSGPLRQQCPVGITEIQPRGMTALFDGIACIIDDTIEYMSALDIQHDVGLAPPKVIVFILTDGLENSSDVWSKSDISTRIRKLEVEYGWEFIFAAANQDAMQVGPSIGVDVTRSITFNATKPTTILTAMRCASESVTRSRNGLDGSFNPHERAACTI